MIPASSLGQTADIYAGRFANQQQVFAHLRGAAGPAFIPDRVEVICNENPEPRLEHWFSHGDSASIEDRLGLNTTCVIIFEHAQAELDTAGTDRLTYLGSFVALRHRP
ncbi:hypothetical protein [uncultured Planktomarina sp.]|uniref:hypothetical protein n=1 Tax=uncultured Planktomarina sp. TaxID=1538529 RepID=UPI002A07313A|nr:hypothetical protein [Paracoccaceae bacterium]MBT6521584.1 hypothetical protein [Paracoccaceae bacterium]MBT7342597.1 hypothetical protein [Paracoccaceae bacterium]